MSYSLNAETAAQLHDEFVKIHREFAFNMRAHTQASREKKIYFPKHKKVQLRRRTTTD